MSMTKIRFEHSIVNYRDGFAVREITGSRTDGGHSLFTRHTASQRCASLVNCAKIA